MKTLSHYITECFDYLVYHFPHIAFDMDKENGLIRVKARKGSEKNILFEFDGIQPGYTYCGKEHITLANLTLALANDTKESVRFGQSVVDDVQPLTPPFIHHPFRMFRKLGTRAETWLIYEPASQLRLVHHFDHNECQKALRYHQTQPLTPEVFTALSKRLSAIKHQAKPTSCLNLHPHLQLQEPTQ